METRNDIPKHLANCSTMKTIIREAAKLLYKYDGIIPTKQETAYEHAKYIFNGVQYSIHYGNTPRRAYTIRKTVTRIQCGYIGGTYLLINQKKTI